MTAKPKTMGTFDEAFAMVQELDTGNARHTRGFHLQEISSLDVLKNAATEMMELAAERDGNGALDELGDVLCCLTHYAVKQGWTLDMLGETMIAKLRARFPILTTSTTHLT